MGRGIPPSSRAPQALSRLISSKGAVTLDIVAPVLPLLGLYELGRPYALDLEDSFSPLLGKRRREEGKKGAPSA